MSLAYAWQNITTTFINSAGISTPVAEITTVPSPAVKRDTIEVTSQDSNGFKEFIAGLTEGDEIEFVMNDVPSDPGQQALLTASEAGDEGTFVLTFKNGRSVSFPAVVNTFAIEEKSDVAANSCKVKIVGPITRSNNPVNLTALSTTAGTLFPAFSATTYTYTVAATNATADCTVTATSAEAEISINGTPVASGTASGNITLGAAGTISTIGITVNKSGCTPTVYKLIVSRAAA